MSARPPRRHRPCPSVIRAVPVVLALVVGLAGCASSDDSGDGSGPADKGAGTGVTRVDPGPSDVTRPTAVRHLAPAAFAEAIKQGAVVIDVRTPAEFAAGHLRGARNMDVNAADFAQAIATLDKTVNYALYCRTGQRSTVAGQRMVAAGFAPVVDLTGGITAWSAEGREVIS